MGEGKRLSDGELEAIREWAGSKSENKGMRLHALLDHIAALEVERAWATLQVSNLTEANDDLRRQIAVIAKERDEARRDLGRSVLDATEAHRAKHAALDEIARLKPSGQVAEDVETLEQAVAAYPERFREDVRAALSRLAAKAQAYESAVAVMDEDGAESQDGDSLAERIRALSEDRQAEKARAEQAETERDTAVAGNAELLEALADADHTDDCAFVRLFRTGPQALAPEAACDCYKAVEYKAHPGAALLEEHRKALVRARNEGLEKVLRWAKAEEERAEGLPLGETVHGGGLHGASTYNLVLHVTRAVRSAVSAMMEPEQ